MNAAAALPAAFPWDAVIAAALGLLRLSARDFWAMTPREVELALSVLRPPRGAPPSRTDFESLLRALPDLQNP